MAGNYQNMFSHQDCIPEEKLLAYIEGSLSPQDSNRVEQHLLECELCSDALEGLRLLHPDKAREITADLNQKIDQRLESLPAIEKGAKVLPFGSFYRIAAIIVLVALVGGGYWLAKNSKEDNAIALNQKPEPVVNTDSAAVQFEAPAGSVSADEATASVQNEIVSSAPKFSLENKQETNQPLAYSTTTESKEDVKPFDGAGKAETDFTTARSDTFFNGNEVALSKVDNSNLSRNQASNAVENYQSSQGVPAAADSKTSGAMYESVETVSEKSKKSSDSKDASRSVSKSVDDKPADERSVFERGKSNYDLKKYDLAANDFEKLVKDSAGKYYDDSKWFLANCYMRTNRNSKAKKLLEEISNSNSVHKKEAFGLLQEN